MVGWKKEKNWLRPRFPFHSCTTSVAGPAAAMAPGRVAAANKTEAPILIKNFIEDTSAMT